MTRVCGWLLQWRWRWRRRGVLTTWSQLLPANLLSVIHCVTPLTAIYIYMSPAHPPPIPPSTVHHARYPLERILVPRTLVASRATSAISAIRMLATAARLLDVTQEIKIDHDNVRDLWARYQEPTNQVNKRALANTLIREMAIHSDAEYVVCVLHLEARVLMPCGVQGGLRIQRL